MTGTEQYNVYDLEEKVYAGPFHTYAEAENVIDKYDDDFYVGLVRSPAEQVYAEAVAAGLVNGQVDLPDPATLHEALTERMGEYFRPGPTTWKLNTEDLTATVLSIIFGHRTR